MHGRALAEEPVSPELVLVSPELRPVALARLPELDAESMLRRQDARAPAVVVTLRLPPWLAALLYVLVMATLQFLRGFAIVVLAVAIFSVLTH